MGRMKNNVADGGNKYSVLFVTTVAPLLTAFMVSSLNVAIPSIVNEFSISIVAQNWIPMANLLPSTALLVPLGKLADIYGGKRIFTAGVVLYTFSCLLLAFSTSWLQLVGFRVLQGVSAAMILATVLAIITVTFPPEERGKALGVNVAAIYVGFSLGPLLGGILTQQFGWRTVFWFNVPFGIITGILSFSKLENSQFKDVSEKFDAKGSVVYCAALIALTFGFSNVYEFCGLITFVLGFIFLLIFVLWEKRIDNPILDIKLFRSNVLFALSNLAALINYGAFFTVSYLISLYLQYVGRFTPQDAGFVLIAQPIVQVAFSPLAGWLSDKFEPRSVTSLGMALTTAGLFLLVNLSEDVFVEYILFCLVLLGLGFSLFASPNANATMSSVDKEFYGVASATLATMRSVGSNFSVGIVKLIFALLIGDVQIKPGAVPTSLFMNSLKVAFTVFTLLCAAGVFVSAARGNVHDKDKVYEKISQRKFC
ncbi:MAG: MFS transporter [Candidatus Bathyarchaeia archaeon]